MSDSGNGSPIHFISAQTLRHALEDGGELALLDVRPHGIYALGHLLFAASAPYWRLELDIAQLVPRLTTRIVLVDQNDGAARDAARKLGRFGYSDVHVLENGIDGWQAAGFQLYEGTNVPSKAFGELLEHELGTPHIDAEELRKKLQNQENIVVVDSRTSEEYTRFSIPGAHSLPGAELVYRIGEVAPDPSTLIVVNCAGRTRSIVGAQTLINANVPNRVVSLRNGTMAWLMDGHDLAHGRVQTLPAPSAENLRIARERARAMAERAGVSFLDAAGLQTLEREARTATLYKFDVRDRQEYLAGHLPGWRWAPGGQLVQATDEYIATRGGHIVLADWDGVRALTTASLLAQLGGFKVHVHAVGQEAPQTLETGPEPLRVLQAHPATVEWVVPSQLADWLQARQAIVVDIEDSTAYAKRHIAGARFVAPHALPDYLTRNAHPPKHVVLTALDDRLALSVAQELQARGLSARPLLGGTPHWVQSGLPTEQGKDGIETGQQDLWPGPYVFDTLQERDDKFNAYLNWELGLVAQLEQEPYTGISLKGSLRARS